MIVVADASPLIALARIGRLEMLHDVFGSICLPDAGGFLRAFSEWSGTMCRAISRSC